MFSTLNQRTNDVFKNIARSINRTINLQNHIYFYSKRLLDRSNVSFNKNFQFLSIIEMQLYVGKNCGLISSLYDSFQDNRDPETRYAILRCLYEAYRKVSLGLPSETEDFAPIIIKNIGWSDCDSNEDFKALNFLTASGVQKRYRDTFISTKLLEDEQWCKAFIQSPAVKNGLYAWMSYDEKFICTGNYTKDSGKEDPLENYLESPDNNQNCQKNTETCSCNIIVIQNSSETLKKLNQSPQVLSAVWNANFYICLEIKSLNNLVVLSLKNCSCPDFSESQELERVMLENVIGFNPSFLDQKSKLTHVLLDDVQMISNKDPDISQQLWMQVINNIFTCCRDISYFNLSKAILADEVILNISTQLRVIVLYLNKNLRKVTLKTTNSEAKQLELVNIYNYENYRFGYNIIELNVDNNVNMPNLSFVNCANIDAIQERFGILNVTKHYLA